MLLTGRQGRTVPGTGPPRAAAGAAAVRNLLGDHIHGCVRLADMHQLDRSRAKEVSSQHYSQQ